MKAGATYYRGAARVVVEDVPIRLARKPSAHNLAWSRQFERERAKPFRYDGISRGMAIAERAKRDILLYAKMLQISESEARARITAHREHLIRNPFRDLSLEYDL